MFAKFLLSFHFYSLKFKNFETEALCFWNFRNFLWGLQDPWASALPTTTHNPAIIQLGNRWPVCFQNSSLFCWKENGRFPDVRDWWYFCWVFLLFLFVWCGWREGKLNLKVCEIWETKSLDYVGTPGYAKGRCLWILVFLRVWILLINTLIWYYRTWLGNRA